MVAYDREAIRLTAPSQRLGESMRKTVFLVASVACVALSGSVLADDREDCSSIDVDQIDDQVQRVMTAAVIGGTVSAVGGGSFANGAVTAAFRQMFNDDAHDLLKEAEKYTGTKYKSGGESMTGIDCSGLIAQSLQAIGIKVGSWDDVNGLIAFAKAHPARFDVRQVESLASVELDTGDVIAFTQVKYGRSSFNHIGIYNDDPALKHHFLSARSSRGVSYFDASRWAKRTDQPINIIRVK